MRAVTISKYGPPSVLEVRESPDPTPKDGEVRIAVRAAGLNFAEVTARQGLYPGSPKPPCVVGYEVAGEVDAVGAGVSSLKIGDRVLAMTRFGGHASSVVVREGYAFPIPPAMTFSEAAALPVNYLTAHHMMFYMGTIHPGSTLLVHMAAGGVGTAVLQLLSTVPNVTSFGTASASKHDYLRKLGCTHPIDYHTQDYVEEVRRLTNNRGVDVILDPLGGPDWKRNWSILAPAGRMVAFGLSNVITGSTRNILHVASMVMQTMFINPMKAMSENKSLQGCNMGNLWDAGDILMPQVRRLIELYERGVVRPHIDIEVPFDRAREAHERIEQRKNVGKVILVP